MTNIITKPVTLIKGTKNFEQKNNIKANKESIIRYLKKYPDALQEKCNKNNYEFDYNNAKDFFEEIINIYKTKESEYIELSNIFKKIPEDVFSANITDFNTIIKSDNRIETIENISGFIKKIELVINCLIEEYFQNFDFSIDSPYIQVDEFSTDPFVKNLILERLEDEYKDLFENDPVFYQFFLNFITNSSNYIKRLYINECNMCLLNKTMDDKNSCRLLMID